MNKTEVEEPCPLEGYRWALPTDPPGKAKFYDSATKDIWLGEELDFDGVDEECFQDNDWESYMRPMVPIGYGT